MARYHRRREADQKGTWRQALVFNSLLLILAVLACRVLVNAYGLQRLDGVTDIQAREETRREIDQAFETIVPDGMPSRAYWADQIADELGARDFSAARGYLLAAPAMLSRDDRRALLAAVAAEEGGTEDERLSRAGLLFLPNDVRANYQRAIERPTVAIDQIQTGDEPPLSMETDEVPAGETAASPVPVDGGLPAGFSMIGDVADLVRRSQQWVNGEPLDTMQLRLSAIGLLKLANAETEPAYLAAISVLRAAGRAGRLDDAYADYLRGRVELALPEADALEGLRTAVSTVVPPSVRQQQVLGAYARAINAEGLERLERDLASIAHIAAETSPSGAVTLIELAQSPEDVRKLELVAQSGSDRAVALAKAIGPQLTGLAQMGIRWSTSLILQIAGLIAIFTAICWSVASAFFRLRPARQRWA
ncbi:hypothetical protein [Henriciella marina]|uniref:hypothetical protein n=1 Tax=Henriciella marina TaxID=453851 RepID=UPI00037BB4AF|nr:hypothetical protein [Henriciella marina]